MSQIKYDVEINAPLERVYEYYTNPDNIQEAWPQDIVKESESLSSTKNEEGSEMKVKGEYMGKEERSPDGAQPRSRRRCEQQDLHYRWSARCRVHAERLTQHRHC